MSTRRVGHIPWRKDGRCRHCGGPVNPPRRTFCSDRCVTDALIQKGDIRIVRRELEKRDHGVCFGCGLDTAQIGRVLKVLAQQYYDSTASATDRLRANEARLWLWTTVTGRERLGTHLWEADHIVPVIEGGGECGLANYRTLCLLCHTAVTAALASRRAQERRAADAAERVRAWTGQPAAPRALQLERTREEQ